jgi:hypothetical protein
VQTRLLERRCDGCGQAITVRRLVGETSYNGLGWVLLCDACLAARVEAVQAEREAPRTCPKGHVIAGENVRLSSTHGKPYAKCRTCHQAWRAKAQGRRKAAREGGAA